MKKMIRRLRDSNLAEFIEQDCCENGICVEISSSIPDNELIIIKVDKFYASLNLELTPPSIDCLIVQKCQGNYYKLTLVELKNITQGRHFDLENMTNKFKTALDDFIGRKFREIFDRNFVIGKLLFVSRQDIYSRDIGLKMEMLIGSILKFQGRRYIIEPRMPKWEVKTCY